MAPAYPRIGGSLGGGLDCRLPLDTDTLNWPPRLSCANLELFPRGWSALLPVRCCEGLIPGRRIPIDWKRRGYKTLVRGGCAAGAGASRRITRRSATISA